MNIKFQFVAIVVLGTVVAFGETVEVPADSAETMGMIKISKTNAVNSEIVFGVPFMKSPSGDTNTVSSVLVAGYGGGVLAEGVGDTVRVWNPAKPASRGYDMWMAWPADGISGSNIWWAINDMAGEVPADATIYKVDRGIAVWFLDNAQDTNDLVQAGLVKPGAQSAVVAGTASNPVKTLLINPYYADVNAAELLANGAKTGDQMTAVNSSVRYEYKEGSGWGTWQKGDIIIVIGGIPIYGPNKFVVETNIPIAGGTAFWYISKGGAPVVCWD